MKLKKALKIILAVFAAVIILILVLAALVFSAPQGFPYTVEEAEADALRDAIKQHMLAEGTEELEAGQYMVRYQNIVSNRFDSSAFKKLMPDVYKSFIRQSTSKRFSIA